MGTAKQRIVLTNVEYFYLGVPSCIALGGGGGAVAATILAHAKWAAAFQTGQHALMQTWDRPSFASNRM